MAGNELDVELRLVVQRFGYDRVYRTLQRIGSAKKRPRTAVRRVSSTDRSVASKKKKSRPSATEYVVKMDIPEGRRQWLVEVAAQFDAKDFLPTIGEVRRFCGAYGVDPPASTTRSNVIPRVFKFISAMDKEEVSEILDSGMFSGPVQLGPIADAIREAGRARREGSWGTDAARSVQTAPERR